VEAVENGEECVLTVNGKDFGKMTWKDGEIVEEML
jgi:hypothetical protein